MENESKGDKRLIFVSQENNNKFYNMHDNGDGTFNVEWGRVGVKSQNTQYDIKLWDRKYKEKIRKGYEDVTEIFAIETQEDKEFIDIEDPKIERLIKELQSYANKSVSDNYTISSQSVTERQIDEAQGYINELAKQKNDRDQINIILLELYKVIPRKMNNVRKHLFNDNGGIVLNKENLRRKIEEEQELLDVMRGQVSTHNKTDNAQSNITLLDAMGLEIENTNDDDLANIEIMMGPNWNQFKQAFKVTNKNTEDKFQRYITNIAYNKSIDLFWHGSRNENWWSILDSGLVLRPSNAIITGKMFGYGIYFADKCQKSVNYTSLRGSYWARGNQSKGFISLFKVNTGSKLHVRKHESWMTSLTGDKLKSKGKYDSLFAEGGIDLRNNEYIVYNQDQVTIKYIVEIQ